MDASQLLETLWPSGNGECVADNASLCYQDRPDTATVANDIPVKRVKSSRAKTGCITCRLRKKRCDESKPLCQTCARLGFHCLGYGEKRPEWVRCEDRQEVKKKLRTAEASSAGRTTASSLITVTDSSSSAAMNDTPGTSFLQVEDSQEEPWHLLTPQQSISSALLSQTPSPYPPLLLQDQMTGSPNTSLRLTPSTSERQLTYLLHYISDVLPLQYRFLHGSIASLVAPLAFSKPHVLESVCSLAALHIGASRCQTRPPRQLQLDHGKPDPKRKSQVAFSSEGEEEEEEGEEELALAKRSHATAMKRFQCLSADDLVAEDVILSVLLSISFYLFRGGVSQQWKGALATCRRCLGAVLSSSSHVSSSSSSSGQQLRHSPLVSIMIWMDILGSVTEGRASRLLATDYRSILNPLNLTSHLPRLQMQHVMGCDNTTLLALAETSALCEWKERSVEAGTLSLEELLQRAGHIARLLEHRNFREGRLDFSSHQDVVTQLSTDVFFAGAHVYLATTVNGPFPRVAAVASAVHDTMAALCRIEQIEASSHLQQGDVYRSLILPIVLAGCHAESEAQQQFFLTRFTSLSPDASAFGNSRQACQLMQHVWHRRRIASPGQPICWRASMRELGWKSGILLV